MAPPETPEDDDSLAPLDPFGEGEADYDRESGHDDPELSGDELARMAVFGDMAEERLAQLPDDSSVLAEGDMNIDLEAETAGIMAESRQGIDKHLFEGEEALAELEPLTPILERITAQAKIHIDALKGVLPRNHSERLPQVPIQAAWTPETMARAARLETIIVSLRQALVALHRKDEQDELV